MGEKTPLYEEHKKLNATMVDFGGWDMPVYYSTPIKEHNETRNSCCIFDICHMGEIFVKGPQAFELLQKTLSRDIKDLKINQMALAVLTNEKGGLLDDLTAYKLSEENFMLVVNSSNIKKDFEWIPNLSVIDPLREHTDSSDKA